MENSRFHFLLDRYLTGDLRASEKIELASMIDLPENQALLEQFVESILVSGKYADDFDLGIDIRKRLGVSLEHSMSTEKYKRPAIHRVHFLKTAWFRYAAAVVFCFVIGAYLWTTNRNDHGLTTTNDKKPLQTDIEPGGEKAVLTLADGSKIVLDNAANGNLANQGSARVVKLANGQIAYDLQGLASKSVVFNTISTPKGGQYQVTLPDGTKIWLNASSSITFPTAFMGNKREVKIQGEIYFEVTKNKQKPFVVDIDGKSSLEVLGTEFNINSYPEENSIKTTLITGTVKVMGGVTDKISGPVNSKAGSADVVSSDQQLNAVILKPGQQAIQSGASGTDVKQAIEVSSNVNLDQILAWKNGLFSFNDSDLRSVMRQLERWYDIKVRYEGQAPDITLNGEMYRNANLSHVLAFLQRMGVKLRMDGKTLIVL